MLEREIPQLQEIVGKTWKKEEELKGLKSELATLDRKIQLELAPPKAGTKELLPDVPAQADRIHPDAAIITNTRMSATGSDISGLEDDKSCIRRKGIGL